MKNFASKIATTQRSTDVPTGSLKKGLVLRKIAASNPGSTKKAVVAALRVNGLAGNASNIERLQALAVEFDKGRRNRCLNKANARLPHPITVLPSPSGRPPVRLPLGLPAQRLLALRKRVITMYAKRAFRHGAPGGSEFIIDFSGTSNEVTYFVELGRNYDVYRGPYKGWAANVDCHRICVPIDWRHRVERRALALLGGMLTLDAIPLEAPSGVKLYAAVWASQGRGYEVRTERGYIAVGANEHFHGATLDAALAGLIRKCRIQRNAAAMMADLALSIDSFVSKYQSCGFEVSLADARLSGSCEYGIRSWCESVGIDITRAQVPIKELLDAFRRMPLTEVRRAVLHAVRRCRAKTTGAVAE